MQNGREWRSFNKAWRQDDPVKQIARWLYGVVKLLSWPLRHPHQAVLAAEPWGIFFAVVGLIIASFAFWQDYADRVEERTVRAWQLLTTKAPGNSGKKEALEYLNRDGSLCFLGVCKKRVSLRGIDLSVVEGSDGAFLEFVDLRKANLIRANLRRANLLYANLGGADLSKADLRQANLVYANLSGVDLSEADLSGAILFGANLSNARLERAKLVGANLVAVDLSNAALRQVDLSGARLIEDLFLPPEGLTQKMLDRACGDENTWIPQDRTIPRCWEVRWHESFHTDRHQDEIRN